MESAAPTQKMNEFELHLHRVQENEFIGSVHIPENLPAENVSLNKATPEMVVILDRSGSMLDSVRCLTHEVFPLFFSKLSIENEHIIHLVFFHSEAEAFSVKACEIENLPTCSEGGTMMSKGIQSCQKVFHKFEKNVRKPIRLITISDGEVQDGEETGKAASEFARYLKEHGFAVNSQAVRLFTTDSQPDTTALCSLLQVNNTTKPQLIDIKTSETNEAISKKMANLFLNDNLDDGHCLVSKTDVLFKFPWLTSPSSILVLVPGKNLFWLKKNPNADEFKVIGASVKVVQQGSLNLAKFQSLIEPQLFHIVDHMKILKVVGTKEANESIQLIVQYFEATEAKLAKKSIAMRLFNIGTEDKRISSALSSIADDSVGELNLAERAAYLRENGFVKNQLERISRKALEIDLGADFPVSTCSISFFVLFAGAAAFVAVKMLRH